MKLARPFPMVRNVFQFLVILALVASQFGLVAVNASARTRNLPVIKDGAAAAGFGSVPFPLNGKSATVALFQEPDRVDPLFSSIIYSAWVAQSVLVGLSKWDANNNLVPELATAIPSTANGGISTDGLTITWHLKPNLLWSDGKPLTSADVKFTWQVLTDSGNAVTSRAGYDQISSIDTPDATTAILHFKSLYPGWPALFSSGPDNPGNIQPKHILQGKTGLQSDPFIHWPTVSSGPWVISAWVAGDHITLLPNANYWRGHPKLDQIVIKFVSDPGAAENALKARSVDFVPGFSETDLADLLPLEPAIHTRADAGADFEHFIFNLGVKGTGVGQSDVDGFCPFKNVAVRKAILLGIDRQNIVNTFLFGKTSVPASLWPNSAWYNTSLTPYPYDPVQASTLLDNAGYTVGAGGIRHGTCNGVDTRLSFNFETTTLQLRKDIAAAVQSMLMDIGIEFKPIFTPSNKFFGNYASGADLPTGKFNMAGYTTGFYPDPYTDNFLCSSVASKQNQAGDNNYHLCDSTLDNLFQQANASADPAVRKPFFNQIQKYMYDNALVVPMYDRLDVMAYLNTFLLPPTSYEGGMMGDTFDWDIMNKISGNAGESGVTLTYKVGGKSKTVSSDFLGNYSLKVLPGWSGTVTPTKMGYTFSPAYRTYTNVTTNKPSQNYTAFVTITGNAGDAGVVLHFTDGTAKTVTSGSNGRYTITVPYNWSGTVTPGKLGVTFNPGSRTYTKITANQTAQDYTDTVIFITSGAYDGWILESANGSRVGGSLNSTAATIQLGDDASNRQYRAILSFNTASLPDTASITAAVLKIDQSGKPIGSNPFSVLGRLYVDIKNGFFDTSSFLQLTDFNAAATASKVGTFGNTPVSGWYTATLLPAGRSGIDKISLTQFRLYFSTATNLNNKADYINFLSGNSSSNPAQLIITYILP